MSWPPSKISKLETARQTPTSDDIVAWTRATSSEEATAALLSALNTLEIQHAEWERQIRSGLRTHQDEIAQLDAATKVFRAFESTFIPGLLQTAEYARARFAQSISIFNAHNDINDAVRARMNRQEVLYRADKRFHFVLTEAVLRYRLCPQVVMVGQLDRLMTLSALPNVRLGIVAFETAYAVAPAHGFWILDESRVMVETFSAELNLAQAPEIGLYGRVFEQLASVASYGRAARAIITRVVDELAPDDPEDRAKFLDGTSSK